MEDILSKYPDILTDYLYLQQRRLLPPDIQLNQLSLTGMRDVVDSLRDKLGLSADERRREQQIKGLGQQKSERVYEDNKVTVYVPRNLAAACALGSKDWCTAIPDEDKSYYDQYARDGDLYIIKPKKPSHAGEQWQFHFPSDQFMDERDHGINLEGYFKYYPGLLEFFKKQEPGYFQDMIRWVDDATLQPLLDKMAEYLNDNLWDIIHEWEDNDSYYYQWQQEQARERGYLLMPDGTPYEGTPEQDRQLADEDGDIDLEYLDVDEERMRDDDEINDYLDYDPEARRWLKRMRETVHMTPEEVRDINDRYGENDTLESLPALLRDWLNEELGRDESQRVANLIDKHLVVEKFDETGQNRTNKGTWQVRWWSPYSKKYY
jgi:hypothetical protein